MPNEELEKKAEKETYHCPVCKKPMENVDFTNAVYFLYNTLYLDDPEQMPFSIDFKQPSKSDGSLRMTISARKTEYPPLHPGETYLSGKSIIQRVKGKYMGFTVLDVGIAVCKSCTQQHDSLTMINAIKTHLLYRDGRTYPRLEEQINELKNGRPIKGYVGKS